jgi:hypothetical protein
MDLFKDKSGLKVISVGFLLGMVSYLHGMPASSLSLSFQGDKVVLVYSGNNGEFDASAYEFLSAASFINNHVIVIDGERQLVAIGSRSASFGSSIKTLPSGYLSIGVNQLQSVNTWHNSVFSDGLPLEDNPFAYIASLQPIIRFDGGNHICPSQFLSSANAVRAGPKA